MSQQPTAAPSGGGSLPNGNGSQIFRFPTVVETLELTSMVLNFNNDGAIAGEFQFFMEWRGGDNAPAAKVVSQPILSTFTSGSISLGKHYTNEVIVGYATSDAARVQIGIPVDTLVDRNTTLMFYFEGTGDLSGLIVHTIRFRMRRDRDRTEVLGSR